MSHHIRECSHLRGIEVLPPRLVLILSYVRGLLQCERSRINGFDTDSLTIVVNCKYRRTFNAPRPLTDGNSSSQGRPWLQGSPHNSLVQRTERCDRIKQLSIRHSSDERLSLVLCGGTATVDVPHDGPHNLPRHPTVGRLVD